MQHVWLSSVLLKKLYTKQLLHRVVTVNHTIQKACKGNPYLFQRQVLFKMAGRCLIVSAVTVIRDANSSSSGTTLTATWVLSNFITSSLAPFERQSAKRCLPHMALPTTLSCRLEHLIIHAKWMTHASCHDNTAHWDHLTTIIVWTLQKINKMI